MALRGRDCVIKTNFGGCDGCDGGAHLRLGTGQKEESNRRRPGRSATIFLVSMCMANPSMMIHEVSRMSRMKGVVVITMRLWGTVLETLTQQKVWIPKTSIVLPQRHLGHSVGSYSSRRSFILRLLMKRSGVRQCCGVASTHSDDGVG